MEPFKKMLGVEKTIGWPRDAFECKTTEVMLSSKKYRGIDKGAKLPYMCVESGSIS